MRLLCALFLTMLAGSASAADWSTEDQINEGIFQVANAVDLSQTLYIAKHPAQYMESQSAWAIGAHPDSANVYTYMLATAVAHVAVTNAMVRLDAPLWMRRTWQAVTIADKVDCIGHNISIGIKLSF